MLLKRTGDNSAANAHVLSRRGRIRHNDQELRLKHYLRAPLSIPQLIAHWHPTPPSLAKRACTLTLYISTSWPTTLRMLANARRRELTVGEYFDDAPNMKMNMKNEK